jgi:hypothetical protein
VDRFVVAVVLVLSLLVLAYVVFFLASTFICNAPGPACGGF